MGGWKDKNNQEQERSDWELFPWCQWPRKAGVGSGAGQGVWSHRDPTWPWVLVKEVGLTLGSPDHIPALGPTVHGCSALALAPSS